MTSQASGTSSATSSVFTPATLRSAFPRATTGVLAAFYGPLVEGMEKADITTNHRVAAFLANVGVESSQLMVTQENGNYSAQGLQNTFGKYFPTPEIRDQYAHHPDAILNRAYANRMGNSYEETGEGFFYRGRGLLMVTGKNNYVAASRLMGVDVFANPELLSTPATSVLSATTFWTSRNLNTIVDTRDFDTVCVTINGGRNGIAERTNLYNYIVKVLGD